MIKQYLGIILSVIYALLIRVLAEWDIIEIYSDGNRIHSNLPAYGKFWSTRIIADFEQKLLTSLKTTLEKQTR